MSTDAPRQDSPNLLSKTHANRLNISFQHIDTLLGEIEEIMHEQETNTAFPSYIADISPAESTCIEDYISSIRSRLVDILSNSGISRDTPLIPASRAVRVRFASIQIAIDELRPTAMQSYGQLSSDGSDHLSAVVHELRELVRQVEYFASGSEEQNLKERFIRLEQDGHDISLLWEIEEKVVENGLVEFRSSIAAILDRAEDRTFEIAVFGRVSSGKSSLLNAILKEETLPVGVTPVTALPIHIRWSTESKIQVSFVDKKSLTSDISDLAQYATEQNNPSNMKHVTRIITSLPAENLKMGIGFADTPGLGSLATTGAKETMAYLPTCDLGIVLIDAASTLTAEDIRTILALHNAAIPVQILISKADLLSDSDQASLTEYIATEVAARYNETYTVTPVSIKESHRVLLETWYETRILPLAHQAQEIKDLSVRRKIGLLKESLEMTLAGQESASPISARQREELMEVKQILLQGSCSIEQLRNRVSKSRITRLDLSPLWGSLGKTLAESVSGNRRPDPALDSIIMDEIVRFVHLQMRPWYDELTSLATTLHEALSKSSYILNIPDALDAGELFRMIHDMPRYHPGSLDITFSIPVFSSILGQNHLEKAMKTQIKEQFGKPLRRSLDNYTKGYYQWMDETITYIGEAYERSAGQVRAYSSRLVKK